MYQDDYRTSGSAYRTHTRDGRFAISHTWLFLWCSFLLWFGSNVTSLAQTVDLDYRMGKNGSYPINGNLNVSYKIDTQILGLLADSEQNNRLLTLKVFINGNPVHVQTVSPNGNDLTYTKGSSYTAIQGFRIEWNQSLPYNVTHYYKAELYDGATLLDTNTGTTYIQTGNLINNASSPTSRTIIVPDVQLYLSPDSDVWFPDGKPNEDDQPVEDTSKQEKIDAVVHAGGFSLAWAATSDDGDTLDMSIHGEQGSSSIEPGQNYRFDIAVPDDWDGTFTIEGVTFDVDSLTTDEFGNYYFDPRIAEAIQGTPPAGFSGVTIDESGAGVLVLTYTNEDPNYPENGTIQQQVTYLTNQRGQVTSTNDQGVTTTEISSTEPTNDGQWDGSALNSAVDQLNSSESGFDEDQWLTGHVDDLGDDVAANAAFINEWKNLRPYESNSLPRLSVYPITLNLGKYGAYNADLDLSHAGFSWLRAAELAAFGMALFASLLKKLSI